MTEDGIITSSRLLLRKIRRADIEQIYDIFSDDRVTALYDCDSFTSRQQAERWLDWNISLYKDKGIHGFRWAITLIEDPCTLIGSCGVHCVNTKFHSLEIGYELHPDYWGKGLASEAINLLMKTCYEQNFPITLNRITAITHLSNFASISLLQKLGFQQEGILKEYGFWKGEYQTVRLFSLLKEDWKKGILSIDNYYV